MVRDGMNLNDLCRSVIYRSRYEKDRHKSYGLPLGARKVWNMVVCACCDTFMLTFCAAMTASDTMKD
jgi:hypothetical protein